FQPLPDERRRRIRGLLYEIIDTAPVGAGSSALDQLKDAAFIPNAAAATELARVLGEEISSNVIRFVGALLTRVGGLILEELAESIEDIQRAVTEWVDSLVDLAGQLGRTITQLAAEIEQKAAELEAAADELLGDLVDLLNHLSAHAGSRQALRRTVRDLAVN